MGHIRTRNYSKMKLTLTAASLALALSTSLLATEATADEALMEGVRPFICDGEAVVFLESNNGWVISTDPTAEVKPIDNGWRYEDTLSGYVWYLREESRNSWVIEGLSEDGYVKADCIDVADRVSQVVTIIKPRLDAAIASIQNDLVETKEALASSEQENVQLIQYNNQLAKQTNDLEVQLAVSLVAQDNLREEVTRWTVLRDEDASRIAVLLAEVKATQSDNDFKTSLLAALSVDDANKVNVATTLELERYRSEFFGQLRDLFEDQNGVRIEGDRLVLSSEVLFESGRALLSRLGESEIAKIALILRVIADEIPSEINWVIRVDGHTDNIPLSGVGAYADNWELSQARALTVVKHMVEVLGIPPSRLAATGFGEFQPISFEDTPEARAQNRRIELVFTEK